MTNHVDYEEFVQKGYWKRWNSARLPKDEKAAIPSLKAFVAVQRLIQSGAMDPKDNPFNEDHQEILTWALEFCKGRFTLRNGYISFENKDDLMLYRLTWGGQ